MTDNFEENIDEFLDELVSKDGIRKAHVDVDITVTVGKRNTGETTENFQEIRERIVTEDEMEEFVSGTEWRYVGPIDVMYDFKVEDRITNSTTIEREESRWGNNE